MKSLVVPVAKISIPGQRVDVIRRDRLASAIVAVVGQVKLVLLCAPAGFGKTVLLAQALTAPRATDAIAWINLEEHDNLQRVVAALIEALEPFDVPWRMAPEAMLQRAEDPASAEALAAEIGVLLASTNVTRGAIAFDDVHRVSDPPLLRFLTALLRHCPRGWTVAMTTREQPAIPLARMLLEGEVSEWREDELRFSTDEVAAVLGGRGLEIDRQRAEQTMARTRGWPVGVVIDRITHGDASSVGQRLQWQTRLFDYLAQEVMESLPPGLQRFLVRCSVIDVMTASRCLQLSGDAHAPRWMEEIAERDLFVTELEGEELTLKLHDLFKEFLNNELQSKHPEWMPELLRLAAKSEFDVVAAVGYLLRAGELDDAALRLLQRAPPMIQAGAGAQLLRLLSQFPDTYRAQSADLAFVRGLCAWHRHGFKTVVLSMQQAAEGFDLQQRELLSLKARSFAALTLINTARYEEGMALWDRSPGTSPEPEVQLMIAFREFSRSFQHGPWQDTPKHIERALALMSSTCDPAEWEYFFPWMNSAVGRPGVHRVMLNFVDMLTSVSGESYPLLRGTALMLRAWMCIWQADLTEGRRLIIEAEADSRWLGQLATIALPCVLLRAVDAQLCGDHANAQHLLDQVVEASSKSPERRPELLHVGFKGAFAAAQGDWETARAQLRYMQERVHLYDLQYVRLDTRVLAAQIALHEGRVHDALTTMRESGPHAADCDRWGLFDRTRITWARAELAAGSAERAWEVLEPVLELARETGNVAGLILCGETALKEIAEILRHASSDPALEALVRRLQSPIGSGESDAGVAATRMEAAQVGGISLSEREIEVLSLITEGKSNKVIARILDLSPHTIKRHVARILEKTGHSGRNGVANWYINTVVSAPPQQ